MLFLLTSCHHHLCFIASPLATTIMNHLRELLPAPGDESQPPNKDSSPSSSSSSKKPRQISLACLACRRRKSKCDGARPACSPCKSGSRDCQYDGEPEDVSRNATLKRQKDNLQQHVDRLEEVLGLLSSRAEAEAASILRLMRAADLNDIDSLTNLIQAVQNGDVLVQLSHSAPADHEDSLEVASISNTVLADATLRAPISGVASESVALSGIGTVLQIV
jgi:hypothetical protein